MLRLLSHLLFFLSFSAKKMGCIMRELYYNIMYLCWLPWAVLPASLHLAALQMKIEPVWNR